MRKELAAQLDEFLEKGASLVTPFSYLLNCFACIECSPFLDALFTALRTKSYLPYNSPPPPPAPLLHADNGIPIPLDAIIPSGSSSPPERSRKRQSEYDNDIRPPKGPRVSQDGPFSRHGPHRGPGLSNGNWGGGGPGRASFGGSPDDVNGAMGPRMNGRGPPTPYPPDQRRGVCRDYYSEHFSLTMSTSYLFVQIMDIVHVARFASTAMVRTHSCRVSFPWVLHKSQEICLCPCFHRGCHSAWVLLPQPMIRMKLASICGPEFLQVPWDVRSAHR